MHIIFTSVWDKMLLLLCCVVVLLFFFRWKFKERITTLESRACVSHEFSPIYRIADATAHQQKSIARAIWRESSCDEKTWFSTNIYRRSRIGKRRQQRMNENKWKKRSRKKSTLWMYATSISHFPCSEAERKNAFARSIPASQQQTDIFV